jgi:hypothetical protein
LGAELCIGVDPGHRGATQTAQQILLNDLPTDLPSVAISTGRVEPEWLERAQRRNIGEVTRFMIVFGPVSTAFDLLTFALPVVGSGAAGRARCCCGPPAPWRSSRRACDTWGPLARLRGFEPLAALLLAALVAIVLADAAVNEAVRWQLGARLHPQGE